MAINEEKLNEFMGKAVGDLGAALSARPRATAALVAVRRVPRRSPRRRVGEPHVVPDGAGGTYGRTDIVNSYAVLQLG